MTVENEKELNADEKRRMLLSRETMEGLEITGIVYNNNIILNHDCTYAL